MTYKDVLNRFGKTTHIKNQQELYPILDEINSNTSPMLLSALVVNGSDYIPGKKFFDKWLGMFDSTKEEQVEAFNDELQKIWQHYCSVDSDNSTNDINNDASIPKSKDFANKILSELTNAENAENAYLDIRSGDLHRILGHYPGPHHRMPVCCNVMRQMMQEGDEILKQPPKGNGANLIIRYHLSRK